VLAPPRRWVADGRAAACGEGLDGALKFAIRRPRPGLAANFLSELSWSFPSGHSLASLVTYGMMAYLIVLAGKGHRRIQIAAALGATLLILSIGFSRLYLGVHYFSDVMAASSRGLVARPVSLAWRWRGSRTTPGNRPGARRVESGTRAAPPAPDVPVDGRARPLHRFPASRPPGKLQSAALRIASATLPQRWRRPGLHVDPQHLPSDPRVPSSKPQRSLLPMKTTESAVPRADCRG
jgi:hypothetical protein